MFVARPCGVMVTGCIYSDFLHVFFRLKLEVVWIRPRQAA